MDLVSQKLIDRLGRRFEAGAILFREGETADAMFFLLRGRVRILKRVGGEQVCLTVLDSGEFFGEMAEDGGLRTESAAAETEVEVVVIDGAAFSELLGAEPRLAARMVHRLGRRLRAADARLVNVMRGDESARIGEGLLRLARRESEKGEKNEGDAASRGPFPMALDDTTLASEAGVLPSVAEPIFAQLQHSGVIARDETGALWLPALRDVEDFVDYCELKRRYDPLRLAELADLAGMSQEEVEVLAERVIAKRVRRGGGRDRDGILRTPLQRYLQLKMRFEFTGPDRQRSRGDEGSDSRT